MSAGMDASVAPAFCHPAFPAGLLRRRQHGLLACCLRSLYLLLCLLVFCPAEAGAEGDLPPAPPAPSLSLELEQLDLSGLPGLPPLPAEDEVLPAAATQALPLPDEAPAADAGAEADAALPEAPRWNALEEGLEYAEFSLQSEAGQQASLTVLRIDPELFDFRLYASAAHKHPALTLGQWADSHDLVAAINASMYLPDGVTSTGYMRQDDYINNKRLVRRFGAFFVAGPRQEGLPRADILTREILRLNKEEGSTVIFSTHNMESVEALCENITLINRSRNILSGNVAEIRSRLGAGRYTVSFEGDPDALFAALGDRVLASSVTKEHGLLKASLRLRPDIDRREVISLANEAVDLVTFDRALPSMNDIFIRTVEDYNRRHGITTTDI